VARIFIADDHKSMRSIIRRLLEANGGFEVCGEAADGREAVAGAQKLWPDLIILDLAMPGMDGLSAAIEIRKIAPQIPILINTLQDSPQLLAEAMRAGVQAVVSKAAIAESLVKAVETLLKKSTPEPSRQGKKEAQ
jgi:two-component system response regulator NreC